MRKTLLWLGVFFIVAWVYSASADVFAKRSDEWVHSLVYANGAAWVLSSECFYEVSKSGVHRVGLPEGEQAYALAELGSKVVVGTSQGIFLLQEGRKKPFLGGWFQGRAVYALLVTEADLWVGTADGVFRISRTLLDFSNHHVPFYFPLSRFLQGEAVRVIVEHEGDIWFASNRNGYYLPLGAEGASRPEPEPLFKKTHWVSDIYIFSGEVWTTGYEHPTRRQTYKLHRADGYDPIALLENVDVSSAGEVDGEVWVGDIDGVLRHSSGRVIPYSPIFAPGSLNAIVQHSSVTWIGTSHALYSRRGGPFVRLPAALGSLGALSFEVLPNCCGGVGKQLWLITSSGAFSLEEGIDAAVEVGGPGTVPFSIGRYRFAFLPWLDVKGASHVREGSTTQFLEDSDFEVVRVESGSDCQEIFDVRQAFQESHNQRLAIFGGTQTVSLCVRDEWGNVFDLKRVDVFCVPWWCSLLVLLAVVLRISGSSIVLYILGARGVREYPWSVLLDVVLVYPRVVRRYIVDLLGPYRKRLLLRCEQSWADVESLFSWGASLRELKQVLLEERKCVLRSEAESSEQIMRAVGATFLKQSKLWRRLGGPLPLLVPLGDMQDFGEIRDFVLEVVQRQGQVDHKLLAELFLRRESFVFLFYGGVYDEKALEALDQFDDRYWSGNFIVVHLDESGEDLPGYRNVHLRPRIRRQSSVNKRNTVT